MKLTRLVVAGVTAALSLLVAVPAMANGQEDVTVTFFHSPGAEAHWAHFTPPPGDPDTWSIKLRLPADPTAYAGARLQGVQGPPPPNPPSFDYYSTVTGPSGGSPRLHMDFSDGGSIELRPLFLTSTWAHEDGSSTDWDNNGGSCGFKYEVPYAVAVGCHPGATVTGVIVVTDSAWLYTSGYTQYIDNIQYGDALITSPEGAGCHEGDGNGNFQGNNGHGDFNFNGDGCRDGEPDQVSSHDRGDGKAFNSTRIDSIKINSLGNTMTIAGAGTSAGVPVTFVLVAVESTPLTPGSVSMTFSDGFTNAGSLLDGSVVLH
ncbi:MAG TPA: hypothetical protein VET26_02675 [Candidatus Sulfotelmatobacter sp.]|nr:hypothetical protein [Candidatus Sulfotelmatobacter sp.]